MKSLFRGDPRAGLDKNRHRITDIDSNIAGLKEKRAELLAVADSDNISEIQTVNKAIEAEESARAIYVAKAAAIQEEVRKLTYQEREGQRSKAIARIKEKLGRRAALAADLELAITPVGHLYNELMGNDEVESLWKFPRPGHGFAAIDRRGIDREIGWALHGLVHQYRLPEPNSAGLGVIGVSAQGIDAIVRANNENIIARLETAPIADDLLEESA